MGRGEAERGRERGRRPSAARLHERVAADLHPPARPLPPSSTPPVSLVSALARRHPWWRSSAPRAATGEGPLGGSRAATATPAPSARALAADRRTGGAASPAGAAAPLPALPAGQGVRPRRAAPRRVPRLLVTPPACPPAAGRPVQRHSRPACRSAVAVSSSVSSSRGDGATAGARRRRGRAEQVLRAPRVRCDAAASARAPHRSVARRCGGVATAGRAEQRSQRRSS